MGEGHTGEVGQCQPGEVDARGVELPGVEDRVCCHMIALPQPRGLCDLALGRRGGALHVTVPDPIASPVVVCQRHVRAEPRRAHHRITTPSPALRGSPWRLRRRDEARRSSWLVPSARARHVPDLSTRISSSEIIFIDPRAILPGIPLQWIRKMKCRKSSVVPAAPVLCGGDAPGAEDTLPPTSDASPGSVGSKRATRRRVIGSGSPVILSEMSDK